MRPEQVAGTRSRQITRYLISFDAHAVDHIPNDEMPAVARAAHEVVEEAMNAGVWVFGAGRKPESEHRGPRRDGHGRCCAQEVRELMPDPAVGN
jgi:hypothetical protein